MMMQAATVSYNRLISLMIQPIIKVMNQIHHLHRKWAVGDTKFRRYNSDYRRYENAFISPSAFKRDAEFRVIVNPSRQQQLQVAMNVMQGLMPILQQVNPEGARMLWKDIVQLSGSHFARRFDQLWPEQPIQPQGPPPQGPPPQPPGLGPLSPETPAPGPVGESGNVQIGAT
jgi:hypothetical protein